MINALISSIIINFNNENIIHKNINDRNIDKNESIVDDENIVDDKSIVDDESIIDDDWWWGF